MNVELLSVVSTSKCKTVSSVTRYLRTYYLSKRSKRERKTWQRRRYRWPARFYLGIMISRYTDADLYKHGHSYTRIRHSLLS